MEDVLEVYHQPHDPECPLVCLDETSMVWRVGAEVHRNTPLRRHDLAAEHPVYNGRVCFRSGLACVKRPSVLGPQAAAMGHAANREAADAFAATVLPIAPDTGRGPDD